MKTRFVLATALWLVGGVGAAQGCELWTRYYGSPPSSTAYPMYRYERYSPGGRPYAWSIQPYYPPRQSWSAGPHWTAPPPPVPRYRYERYSPAGYPYLDSRVDYYPPVP